MAVKPPLQWKTISLEEKTHLAEARSQNTGNGILGVDKRQRNLPFNLPKHAGKFIFLKFNFKNNLTISENVIY